MNIVTPNSQFVASTRWTWQQHVKAAIRSAAELRRVLGLPLRVGEELAGERQFETFAPLPFVARMEPGNEADPLLRQVLPTAAEGESVAGFSNDPNAESEVSRAPGVLQKYPGRALLIAAKTCAVNCRYCFRRAYPYESGPTSREDWRPSLDQIAADHSIEEVILSGGEPLINDDTRLEWLVQEINRIPHIRRLRIHSRFPIVIPQRVTKGLLELLSDTRLPTTMVLHTNHAQELGDDVGDALTKLRQVPRLVLLNQSVLLRGINDSVQALTELSWRLLEFGVVPYYLHQLDRVTGSHHFEVEQARGLALIEQLRNSLPGYAVPRYAVEVPGCSSKQILA